MLFILSAFLEEEAEDVEEAIQFSKSTVIRNWIGSTDVKWGGQKQSV